MKYAVYRNLHNGKLSVKDLSTGLVVGHADRVEMSHVDFKVNAMGLARIRRFKRKEVVATVQGRINEMKGFESFKSRPEPLTQSPILTSVPRRIGFNPYFTESFVDTETQERVDACERLAIDNTGVMMASRG